MNRKITQSSSAAISDIGIALAHLHQAKALLHGAGESLAGAKVQSAIRASNSALVKARTAKR